MLQKSVRNSKCISLIYFQISHYGAYLMNLKEHTLHCAVCVVFAVDQVWKVIRFLTTT